MILSQLLRFVLVGLSATLASYAVLIVLVEMIGQDAVVASAIAYIVGGAVNYLLNYHYTFSSQQSHRIAASRFLIVLIIGLALNVLIMKAAITLLGLHYLLAQLLAICFVMGWSFLANKFWSFAPQVSSPQEIR